jgi:NAD(P)-dependent dehydrogenase (short-subunit alcohol dehydrogenase family)
VLVADLDQKLAERTVEMIQAEGGTAAAHAGDVTKETECRQLVDAAVDRWGRLDFLDNNVGIGSRGSVVDQTRERLQRANANSAYSGRCIKRSALDLLRRARPFRAAFYLARSNCLIDSVSWV